jgi:CSLREA domain-containing protein
MSFPRFFRRRVRNSPNLRHRKMARVVRIEPLEDRRLLASITVNTTADDATPDATLSLREAIEVSDGTLAISSLSTQEQAQVSGAVGASNTIGFNIPTTDSGYDATTGVWTIAVQSALPAISTNAAIINGYSQPGASANTLAQGDNAKLAVAISGKGSGTLDGLTIAQQGSQVFGLDIEDFGGYGILITAGGNVQVAGCFIGTDPTGETAAPDGYGVEIENSFNTIGGPLVGNRNVISGNSAASAGDGIIIPDQSVTVTGTLVENNFIGIDAAGTKALANSEAGIADFGTGNTYGGTTAGLGNVISGNVVGGIRSTGGITVEGNDIGTDATGNTALGNGPAVDGISDIANSILVITTTITNNLVSGNSAGGIAVSGGADGSVYTISNNKVGTNAAGTAALANGAAGLEFASLANATVDNNLISGNNGLGISFTGFGTAPENDVFQGNKIGTDITGVLALGNADAGASFTSAVGIVFGGTGAGQGNVVAFNGGDGVDVLRQGASLSEQVQITQNSIFGNAGKGIYLDVNGVSNEFAVAPVMTFTPSGGGIGTLSGTLKTITTPHNPFVVEIYSNPTVPTVGHEQGKTFVQSVTVTTNGSGVGTFSVTEPTGIYTATATDSIGDTSQFSLATVTTALDATVTSVSSSLNPSTVGQAVTFTAVVTAPTFQGTPTGSVTFTIDGHAQTPVALAVVGGADQAQFSTSALAAGAHTISAAYSGDATFATSSGSLPTQTVDAASLLPTTTAVSSSLNPSTVGQAVTFTAIVAATGSQSTPTGTVTFTIDGQAQTPVSLSVVGGADEAQFSTSTLAAGGHTISAAYSGDATFAASSANLPTQTVNAPSLLPTTTVASSSLNPSTVGQAVTFTAIVAATGSQTAPTGTVTFTVDGHTQTPVPLSLVGGVDQAQFTTSGLAVGAHTISAAYGGDSAFAPSSVSLPAQTVNAAPRVATTTGLSTSTNPSVFGGQVVLTATVTSADSSTVGGSVTFMEGATVLGVVGVGPGGKATLDESSLPVGSDAITAIYSGDAGHTQSTSNPAMQVVETPPSTVVPTVVSPPPTIAPTVVSLHRFGYHMQPTTLVLTFSTALDAASATDVSNYRITTLGGHGRRGS